MKKILKNFSFILQFSVLFLFCFYSSPSEAQRYPQFSPEPQKLAYVNASLGNNPLKLMIARTQKERAKGLMFYEEIASSTGMLFVFEEPHKMSFWMMNTRIPLDLIFFSEDLTVTEWIKNMVPGYGKPPYRLPHYASKEKAKYALELKSGSIEELNIKIGDKLEIPLILLYCE